MLLVSYVDLVSTLYAASHSSPMHGLTLKRALKHAVSELMMIPMSHSVPQHGCVYRVEGL
jgi:hypothetical protein